jgi:hypothetical protein
VSVVGAGRIDANERLLLSAIADRLVFGDVGSFRREDALELLRLLPRPLGSGLWEQIFRLRVQGSFSGRSATGFAADVGDVSFGGDEVAFDMDSRGRKVVRAGQWKLFVTRNTIEIEQVGADDADEGRTARVEFVRGEPVRMTLLAISEVVIGPLAFAKTTFRPWKVPVSD